MLMEAYDIRAATFVVLLLDTPSVYLYSTRVMGIPHAEALIPSAGQIIMGLVIQALASLIRIRTDAAGRRSVSDAARAENERRGGVASTSTAACENSPSSSSNCKEDKKTQ